MSTTARSPGSTARCSSPKPAAAIPSPWTARPTSAAATWPSRPMEVVLMGMGGCTAIDVVSMLKKQRQDIEGVEVSLVAERADDHPKVFTAVKLVYTVRGRKLNRALIERAVSLSDEKYCSATAMIRKSAKVTHEVVLVEQATA